MQLARAIKQVIRRYRGTRRLRGSETIETVRARHDEFPGLVETIRQSGTDSLIHFGNGYTFEGGLYLQQNPDELAALCLLLRDRGPFKTYLEIGSASGGTCLFLNRFLGFEQVYSVDDGQHPRASSQGQLFAQVPGCRRFLGDSHSEAAREFLRTDVKHKLDVAFIDGDHSYAGVIQDIRLVLPSCRPGTLIIFHDTLACDGVERAWIESEKSGLLRPLAEFAGAERPLGIGVAMVP